MQFKEKQSCRWITAEGAFLLSCYGLPFFPGVPFIFFLHRHFLLWFLLWTCQQHLRNIALSSTSSHQNLNEKTGE